MHTPVLLQETVNGLAVKKGGRYIDATAGAGGHLEALLKLGAHVLAIDWDENQLIAVKRRITNRSHLILVPGNFGQIETIAKKNRFDSVDGVIFDLGLSFNQLSDSGRGFSFKNDDDPLDMRINEKNELKAADLLNSLTKDNLYEIFAKYGEEINSLSIAETIVRTRTVKPYMKVRDLKESIDKTVKNNNNRIYARIFQALRIGVNDELTHLKAGLAGALKILSPKGRMVVISFHSVEDRVVKKFGREQKLIQITKLLGRSRNRPSFEQSAVLRVFAKSV